MHFEFSLSFQAINFKLGRNTDFQHDVYESKSSRLVDYILLLSYSFFIYTINFLL